ncbi:MAG: ParB/RepB/Spo0J family partition protein [bacterium]
MSKQRLGKGLDELLPDDDDAAQASLNQLPLDEIAPNPHQPRDHFDEDKLEELTESIRQQGVVEPIVVRPYPDGEKRYMIVAGERRWRATRQTDRTTIPGIVRELEASQAYVLSLVENLQRENLSPLEEARAYNRIMEEKNYDQSDVAEAVGKSRSSVANRIRLLNLPEAVRDALESGSISAGHARALLGAESNEVAESILDDIIRQNLSVRATEQLVSERSSVPEPDDNDRQNDDSDQRPQHFDRLEADLESSLGADVEIQSEDRKSGDIIIHFNSPEEFDELKERFDQIDVNPG